MHPSRLLRSRGRWHVWLLTVWPDATALPKAADLREWGRETVPMSRVGDVLGVPRLPPGWVARAVNRTRAGLARTHRVLAPPPLRILEGALGHLDTAALGAFCRLGIADHLTRRSSVADLAAACHVDEAVVDRIVRFGATRGWVAVDRRGRVSPVAVTAFLRRDHPGGWRAWVDFAAGPEVMAAVAGFAAEPGRPDAFVASNGAPFFEWQTAHPLRQRVFDAAMAAGGQMHGLAIAAALDWADTRRVCDVGGGNGALLRMLMAEHPHLAGVVFDLPVVVADVATVPGLSAVGGDAFVSVPTGCDTYLLVNVIHDWSDDDAARLLTNVARAMPHDGRVIIVEGERTARPLDGVAARTDLLMLVLTNGGHERTTAEITTLARRAGLQPQRTVTLASADRAHVFVPI
jgi:hypothetical protein